jgi:hypothetical protein
MLPVRVTVSVGARKVPLDEVTDKRITSAFRKAADDVGKQLAAIRCPVHQKTATNVRVHFDPRGGADLQYDSCCEKLGAAIGARLG